jgi:hypothetical protein
MQTATPRDGASKGVNQGVAPVTYGQGERPPRGDYAKARADYTCEQDWAQYGEADHDTYRRLYARQLLQLRGRACDEFITAVQQLGAPEQIPRFDEVSARLMKATGWQNASSRSRTGCASPRSSTMWSSPMSSTTSSAMCRCSSTRSSPTICRPTVPAA